MVQILVRTKDDPSSIKEWAIIEVQGDLEHSDGGSIAGKHIGQLYFTSKDRPVLIVGYHILFGKVVENNPPFAIMKRHRPSDMDSLPSEDKKKSTEFQILALVKKKIVFKTRPKPIVTTSHP